MRTRSCSMSRKQCGSADVCSQRRRMQVLHVGGFWIWRMGRQSEQGSLHIIVHVCLSVKAEQ